MFRARTMGDDISILVLERRLRTTTNKLPHNADNFLHNCSNFFLFVRTTSEEPDILSCCPRTSANKLPHNSGNIYERRDIVETYCLLQCYFNKIHNSRHIYEGRGIMETYCLLQ